MVPTRALVVLSVLLGGCGEPYEDPTTKGGLSAEEATELVELVGDYANRYGCVDDLLRVAPTMCRAPTVAIRMSAADGENAHTRKLYWLFAKDRDAYLAVPKQQDQPVGQLVIKETWVPADGDATEDTPGPYGADKARRPPRLKRAIVHGGKTVHPGSKHALFVMWKRAAGTPSTDAGWTYATLTPDGTRVTASGRLKNCMACHEGATHDRMFGLPAKQ